MGCKYLIDDDKIDLEIEILYYIVREGGSCFKLVSRFKLVDPAWNKNDVMRVAGLGNVAPLVPLLPLEPTWSNLDAQQLHDDLCWWKIWFMRLAYICHTFHGLSQ